MLDGPGDAWATVLATEWDTAADAAEFEAAARPVVEALDNPAALLPGGTDTGRWVVVASTTTCSSRSPGRSAWRVRSPRPPPYIESGAEIPSNARALASVIRAASASASRFAERSGSAGSTTRASR